LSLTPLEISKIEKLIEASRLTEVKIVQNGEPVVIGGASSGSIAAQVEPVAVNAPMVGSIFLGNTQVGQRVTEGDILAQLNVLERGTSLAAPLSGRITAILAKDKSLVAYGAAIILIEPENAS
jgi:acetyl/propionyl-CoA carboxylase alpha subunit